jgi:hypothetical protein
MHKNKCTLNEGAFILGWKLAYSLKANENENNYAFFGDNSYRAIFIEKFPNILNAVSYYRRFFL